MPEALGKLAGKTDGTSSWPPPLQPWLAKPHLSLLSAMKEIMKLFGKMVSKTHFSWTAGRDKVLMASERAPEVSGLRRPGDPGSWWVKKQSAGEKAGGESKVLF